MRRALSRPAPTDATSVRRLPSATSRRHAGTGSPTVGHASPSEQWTSGSFRQRRWRTDIGVIEERVVVRMRRLLMAGITQPLAPEPFAVQAITATVNLTGREDRTECLSPVEQVAADLRDRVRGCVQAGELEPAEHVGVFVVGGPELLVEGADLLPDA